MKEADFHWNKARSLFPCYMNYLPVYESSYLWIFPKNDFRYKHLKYKTTQAYYVSRGFRLDLLFSSVYSLRFFDLELWYIFIFFLFSSIFRFRISPKNWLDSDELTRLLDVADSVKIVTGTSFENYIVTAMRKIYFALAWLMSFKLKHVVFLLEFIRTWKL